MDLMRSWGLVRRILLLSAVPGVLILFEGSAPPSRRSPPAPRRSRPPAAAKKVPPPPASPRHEREFPNFEGHKSGLSFAKDEVHVYLFDLEPDDFVDIEVEQEGLDVMAKIVSPGGASVEVDRLNGKNGPENVFLLAEVAGRYRVELTGGGGGTYQILAPAKRKADLQDQQSAAGALAYSRGWTLTGKEPPDPRAEQEFGKALELWEASGFKGGQADAAFQLQQLLWLHDAAKALRILEKDLRLYRELRILRQEAIVLYDLGLVHSVLGNNDQALGAYESALELARRLKDLSIEADVLLGRGRLYCDLSEFGKALADLNAALGLRRSLKDSSALADTLNALGRAYFLQDDLDTAWSLHKEAQEILRAQRNTYIEAETFGHLGDVKRKKREYRLAILRYLNALTRLQRTGHVRDEAIVLNNLALVYVAAGRQYEALNAFRHCQKLFEAQGEVAESATAWSNIGWVLASMYHFKEARAAFYQSLAMSRGRKRLLLEAASYSGLAWNEWRRGNLSTAQAYLEQALDFVEQIRTRADRAELRTSFLAGWHDQYDQLVEILMEQHRRNPIKGFDLKAFEVSERARSRKLLDSLVGRIGVPKLTVREIQQQVLGDGEAVLLEYFLGDNRSYLWVVTASSFASYELPARRRIQSLAEEVQGLLKESHKPEKQSKAIQRSTSLSRMLFGQVANRLAGKKLLIVAPPELQYISFGALPEYTRESRHPSNGWPTPWIEGHEITAEPSATVLATLRHLHKDKRSPSGLIGILADPVYSPDDERLEGKGTQMQPGKQPPFLRLAFSQREAQAVIAAVIEAGLGNDKRLLALGFDANRQRVLNGDLRDFRYLHFSAHGDLDVRNSDRSAIVLSLVDQDRRAIDGHLRAGEIEKLELPADLVVLSACNTGLGREIKGEGLLGLTQAFLTAGASRVTVSLWDVDDQATTLLMGLYYQKLFKEHLTPSAALREAQVYMWRQQRWNAPFYWGGFVLQGEWK